MLGETFAPLGDPMNERMQNQGSGPVSPVQEAIRLLSLKIPRATGAGMGAIPTQLMTGMGGSMLSGAGAGGIEQILRTIMGTLGGGGSAPPPVIKPIEEGEPLPGTFKPGGFDEEPAPPPPVGPPGARGRSNRGPGTGSAIQRPERFSVRSGNLL